jgi:hypothetical protein
MILAQAWKKSPIGVCESQSVVGLPESKVVGAIGSGRMQWRGT